MLPIRTELTNFVYKLEGGTEENDLPCTLNDLGSVSTWEFDADDWLLVTANDDEEIIEDVFVCIAVWGNYETISEHLVVRFRIHGENEDMAPPVWLGNHDNDKAIAAQPMDDEQRRRVAADGKIDLFIAAKPIPPVAVWSAYIGPCGTCGATALHPCPHTGEDCHS